MDIVSIVIAIAVILVVLMLVKKIIKTGIAIIIAAALIIAGVTYYSENAEAYCTDAFRTNIIYNV